MHGLSKIVARQHFSRTGRNKQSTAVRFSAELFMDTTLFWYTAFGMTSERNFRPQKIDFPG